MTEVEIECKSCKATGVYRGFAEPAGVGVVCLKCRGTGCTTITYTPFAYRKERRDIRTVQLSRGAFVATGVGPGGKPISYAEFLAGGCPTATEGGAS